MRIINILANICFLIEYWFIFAKGYDKRNHTQIETNT